MKQSRREQGVLRDRETLYNVEGSVHQDRTILIAYSPNNSISKYIKQKLIKLKGKIDKFPIIVRDFNTTLSVTEPSRQKIKVF